MDDVLKKLGTKSLTDFIGDLSLHWGASEEITCAQAKRHKDVYIAGGENMWNF